MKLNMNKIKYKLGIGGFLFWRIQKLQETLDEANSYLEMEEYDNAIDSYNEAIKIMPKSADAYLGLMKAYIGKGDLDTALEAITGILAGLQVPLYTILPSDSWGA